MMPKHDIPSVSKHSRDGGVQGLPGSDKHAQGSKTAGKSEALPHSDTQGLKGNTRSAHARTSSKKDSPSLGVGQKWNNEA